MHILLLPFKASKPKCSRPCSTDISGVHVSLPWTKVSISVSMFNRFRKHTLKYFIYRAQSVRILDSYLDPSLKSVRSDCFTYLLHEEVKHFQSSTKSVIHSINVKTECSDVQWVYSHSLLSPLPKCDVSDFLSLLHL